VNWRVIGRYLRGLAPPILLLGTLAVVLGYVLYAQADVWQRADELNLREWLDESRVFRKTLSQLAQEYRDAAEVAAPTPPPNASGSQLQLVAEEIHEQLRSMGAPLRMYQGHVPLFPVVYSLELWVKDRQGRPLPPIVWDSGLPRDPQRTRHLQHALLEASADAAVLHMVYQVHVNSRQQQEVEAEQKALFRWVAVLAVAAPLLAIGFVYFFVTGERRRELQQFLVRQQIDHAEKIALENKLHREELERKHQEVERNLLKQRIATQEAEQKALELRSKLYASIGVMAGSYAHNIKNLLVRPNDLLRRCLETEGAAPELKHMLGEVQNTLGTVTERLHEILKTVRRDPTRAEKLRFDLNELAAEIVQTWQDMARDKWKLNLTAELASAPLIIEADRSHLTQAVENLVFNARDATFEMRNLVREEARANQQLDAESKKSALIAAATWRGNICLRTRREDGWAVLEVSDNGIGMTEEVRRRCTETHFSTKRDNALYEGNTTGMGLGLSFVQTILDHHEAEMEIVSAPRKGATFRIRLRSAASAAAASPAQ